MKCSLTQCLKSEDNCYKEKSYELAKAHPNICLLRNTNITYANIQGGSPRKRVGRILQAAKWPLKRKIATIKFKNGSVTVLDLGAKIY